MFRRWHLNRFLLIAAVLVFNAAIIVYLFERHAPGMPPGPAGPGRAV